MLSCWHTPRVTAAPTALPDLDRLDATGLKALILSQHEQLLSHRSEIEQLKLLIAKLRRMQFGRKSEKLDRQIEQLELKLEELESAKKAKVSESASPSPAPPSSTPSAAAKPARQPLPGHLPREVRTYAPKEEACAKCGGRLRRLGEDVSVVGGTSRLLEPLVEALRRHVMSARKLHADDTPVPVLAPGNGKTRTGRLWTYVRDDRPAGDDAPAAVWFAYSPDRRGEHPRQHLRRFSGCGSPKSRTPPFFGCRSLGMRGSAPLIRVWEERMRQWQRFGGPESD